MAKYKNVTNGIVSIFDLGVTIHPGETVDLDSNQEMISKDLRNCVNKKFLRKMVQNWLGIPQIMTEVKETITYIHKDPEFRKELDDVTKEVQKVRDDILELKDLLKDFKLSVLDLRSPGYTPVNKDFEHVTELDDKPLFIPSIEDVAGDIQLDAKASTDANIQSSVEKLKNMKKKQQE